MQNRWFSIAPLAAVGAGAIGLAGKPGVAAEDKKDEKLPRIKEIMTKGHKGTDAYLGKIGKEAKAGKWEDAQADAKGLAYFGESLGKLEPPKGDAKSWAALSKKYAEATAAVKKAADDKDAKAVEKSLGAIGQSCGACHGKHK